MYKLLFASVAVLALASPASARDGSGYVGLELGISLDTDAKFDLRADDGIDVVDVDNAFKVDFSPGRDFDLIGGYDLGLIRAEAELGYKRVSVDAVKFNDDLFDELPDANPDVGGRATIYSLMGNALFDVLNIEGSSAYVGAGIGRARVKLSGDKDNAWAWQLIAGMRAAVSSNVDIGVKYRFFNTTKLKFGAEDEDGFRLTADGKLRSHSVLLSLIYNFAGAPPAPAPIVVAEPPPPPPPPPATQTCPDGSVILATDACPLPPAPPPPPPPEPERG
ncbi:MAG: outer membrane beta-barrel protein [Sphingomicrobium sp.]